MTLTDRARTRRAHVARKNARRRLNDPVLRAAVLTQVFGRRWVQVVTDFYAARTEENHA